MPGWSPVGLYRVAGDSMAPTYHPGDTLLGWRWFKPRVGLVVVADVAGRPLIKRITRLEPTRVWLEGDNAASSTDSRQFGAVPAGQLEARVILRLGKG